ncbi:5e77fe05-432f-4c79-b5f1-d6a812deb0be-CDS [Sclerotinia trifoliorum]|uniref:5e77fe05-432f-4c79-b5f1-d6a812deb0be-CDS n=1 Tax=Sclerotinia trifoliorum TaxID=28548 RepID=A0A8H2VY19_9HELO|nr:5e77fe05-432f-4c79-b5f1-d6a812deb0be-CDS [Sclerotinia trifoliorum]
MSTIQTQSHVVARLIPQNLYARQAHEELRESDVVQKHYKTLLRCQVPEGDNAAIPRAPTQLDDPDMLHDFGDNWRSTLMTMTIRPLHSRLALKVGMEPLS